jgi:hypothetical protein
VALPLRSVGSLDEGQNPVAPAVKRKADEDWTRKVAAGEVGACSVGTTGKPLLLMAKRGTSTTLKTYFKCSAVAVPFRRGISSTTRARHSTWLV